MVKPIDATYNYLISMKPGHPFVPFIAAIPVISNIFLHIREEHFKTMAQDYKESWGEHGPEPTSEDYPEFLKITSAVTDFYHITKSVLWWNKAQFIWFPILIVPALEKISLKWRLISIGCLAFSAIVIEDHFGQFKKYTKLS